MVRMGCTAYLLFCFITYDVCSSMETSKIEKGRMEVPSNNDDNIIKCHRSIKYFLVMHLFFLSPQSPLSVECMYKHDAGLLEHG